MFLNKFIKFLPVETVSCGNRPSRLWLVIQVQTSGTIPWFFHTTTYSTNVHSIFTTKFSWEFHYCASKTW
jgi:hypothetical protein